MAEIQPDKLASKAFLLTMILTVACIAAVVTFIL